MNTTPSEIERLSREQFTRYFDQCPNAAMKTRAMKALRLITASGERLAGIVYFLANQDRQACGVPGLRNSEVESFFGVTMGTIRKRAARVGSLLAV